MGVSFRYLAHREILKDMRDGFTAKSIAARIGLNEPTNADV
jgi:DNA-binding NarL/FixJ family response regulator